MANLEKIMRTGRPDHFQTPKKAIVPLLDFISPDASVWEPACGKGNLVRAFEDAGRACFFSDVIPDHSIEIAGLDYPVQVVDFLRDSSPFHVTHIVTNPPYKTKDKFLARCYELGIPFALLMPIAALAAEKRMGLYRKHGIQLLMLPERLHFETPNGKSEGNGSNAWFASAWFTWGMGLPQDIYFWQPERHSLFPPDRPDRRGKPRSPASKARCNAGVQW